MQLQFVLQGTNSDRHLSEIRNLISIEGISTLIVSVAFLNQRGLSMISDLIEPISDKTVILAGIRNGVTTVQGLRLSVNIGCMTYAFDTGSSSVYYHPKIYLARGENEARVLLGSANLTFGGLISNFEASLRLDFDMKVDGDVNLLNDIEQRTLSVISGYPENVFRLSTEDAVNRLFESGQLTNEESRRVPVYGGFSNTDTILTVPKIDLARLGEIPIDLTQPSSTVTNPIAGYQNTPTAIGEKPHLVWKSNPLSRRDLNIPTGSNTNQTGSMLFKKGNMTGIDQRRYFRYTVFSNLNWINDSNPSTEHYERAEARFQLVIRGVEYGPFTLRVSHNTRTDTPTYIQGNSMTQLHWGEARSLIQNEALIDSTAYLYKMYDDLRLFILEID